MIITLFGYQFLYLNDKMDFIMNEKFEAKQYVTAEQLDLSVSKAVFAEREEQAAAKTTSLSWGIANEMSDLPGWERENVGRESAKVLRYGYEMMQESEEREEQWNKIISVFHCGVIFKKNEVGILTKYYRDVTGDYLVKYELLDGERRHYWEGDDMLRHPLRELDKIKVVHLQ